MTLEADMQLDIRQTFHLPEPKLSALFFYCPVS